MELSHESLRHILYALLLVSRVGDVATTYLITPKLILEANPFVRKLGWRFALLTIAACVLHYFSPQVAVAVLMPSLLVSASNAGKVWVVRTMGEAAYQAFLIDIARRSRLSHALIGVLVSALFIVLAGATVLVFYPSPTVDWGFWLGLGIVGYGFVVAFLRCAVDCPPLPNGSVSSRGEGRHPTCGRGQSVKVGTLPYPHCWV